MNATKTLVKILAWIVLIIAMLIQVCLILPAYPLLKKVVPIYEYLTFRDMFDGTIMMIRNVPLYVDLYSLWLEVKLTSKTNEEFIDRYAEVLEKEFDTKKFE